MGELKKWREENGFVLPPGDIAGACGTSKNKSNPDRCLPLAKARSMSKLKEPQLPSVKEIREKETVCVKYQKGSSHKNIQNVNYGNYQHIQLRQHY